LAAAADAAKTDGLYFCRDPYPDMLSLEACGPYEKMELPSVVCWSIDELRERLVRGGHVVWKDGSKQTGGEYVVAYGAVAGRRPRK
jgi:hypothetical protein